MNFRNIIEIVALMCLLFSKVNTQGGRGMKIGGRKFGRGKGAMRKQFKSNIGSNSGTDQMTNPVPLVPGSPNSALSKHNENKSLQDVAATELDHGSTKKVALKIVDKKAKGKKKTWKQKRRNKKKKENMIRRKNKQLKRKLRKKRKRQKKLHIMGKAVLGPSMFDKAMVDQPDAIADNKENRNWMKRRERILNRMRSRKAKLDARKAEEAKIKARKAQKKAERQKVLNAKRAKLTQRNNNVRASQNVHDQSFSQQALMHKDPKPKTSPELSLGAEFIQPPAPLVKTNEIVKDFAKANTLGPESISPLVIIDPTKAETPLGQQNTGTETDHNNPGLDNVGPLAIVDPRRFGQTNIGMSKDPAASVEIGSDSGGHLMIVDPTKTGEQVGQGNRIGSNIRIVDPRTGAEIQHVGGGVGNNAEPVPLGMADTGIVDNTAGLGVPLGMADIGIVDNTAGLGIPLGLADTGIVDNTAGLGVPLGMADIGIVDNTAGLGIPLGVADTGTVDNTAGLGVPLGMADIGMVDNTAGLGVPLGMADTGMVDNTAGLGVPLGMADTEMVDNTAVLGVPLGMANTGTGDGMGVPLGTAITGAGIPLGTADTGASQTNAGDNWFDPSLGKSQAAVLESIDLTEFMSTGNLKMIDHMQVNEPDTVNGIQTVSGETMPVIQSSRTSTRPGGSQSASVSNIPSAFHGFFSDISKSLRPIRITNR